MNEKIQIEVKYSADEYVRGMIFSQRRNSSGKYSSLIMLTSGLIAAVGVYYFIHLDEIGWNSDLLLNFLFFLVIVIPISYIFKDVSFISEIILKKQYDSTPLLQETFQIRFDDEGINSESKSFTNKLRWNAVIEAVESDEDFHFFFAPNSSLFIPKRVFTDEHRKEIKNFVQMKLGEKAKF